MGVFHPTERLVQSARQAVTIDPRKQARCPAVAPDMHANLAVFPGWQVVPAVAPSKHVPRSLAPALHAAEASWRSNSWRSTTIGFFVFRFCIAHVRSASQSGTDGIFSQQALQSHYHTLHHPSRRDALAFTGPDLSGTPCGFPERVPPSVPPHRTNGRPRDSPIGSNSEPHRPRDRETA